MSILSISVVKSFIPIIDICVCLFLMSENPIVVLFKSANSSVKTMQVLISEYLGSVLATSWWYNSHTIKPGS